MLYNLSSSIVVRRFSHTHDVHTTEPAPTTSEPSRPGGTHGGIGAASRGERAPYGSGRPYRPYTFGSYI